MDNVLQFFFLVVFCAFLCVHEAAFASSYQISESTDILTVSDVTPQHTHIDTLSDSVRAEFPTYGFLRSFDRLVPDDPIELYTRAFLSSYVSTTFMLRPGHITQTDNSTAHPWTEHRFYNEVSTAGDDHLVIFSPRVFTSYNSHIPFGQNDGSLWQGKGWNSSVSVGGGATYGPLTVVFKPVFSYSENREFELSPYPQLRGLSSYGEAFMNADIPQRFGEDPFNTFDIGDSFVQVGYSGISAGVSNQRMWTGPALYNPLIFSYHAPGFMHGFIGTSEPFKFRYGSFETRWFWGGLEESTYFDENPSNNLRYVSGLVFNYSPEFISGLHLGFTRTSYANYPDSGIGFSDIFLAFRLAQPDNVTDPVKAYQTMMSYYARWIFPGADFEIYGEWGRNDNRRRIRDILAEPELNRGYVFGFIKSFSFSDTRKLLFTTEFSNLENSSVASQQRDFNTWYEHDIIRQGFTHRGQVLGAGIGPGSSTQIMNLSYYGKRGMAGVSAQRVVMFNDRFHRYKETYRELHPWPQFWFMIGRQMTQMNYGFHSLLFFPFGLEVQFDYQLSKVDNQYNRYFRDVSNNHFQVTLRYQFGGLFN